MNPLYFGTRERRIYGLYEPPSVRGARTRAAVLCYPWGSEYVCAHRSMRQLALRLSLAGYHTLRFDFFGTGDSAGEMTDGDLSGWETDVESAIEGIEDIVGAARVSLVGLRLGANIAARLAARRPGKIDALVMWDPIVSGEEYLRELGLPPDAPDDTLEVRGFPLSPAMMREFQGIDLRDLTAAPATRSLMLVTDRETYYDSFTAAPSPPGCASLTLEYLASESPWLESALVSGAVPVRAIQRIVEWLG